jgi:type III pantothenate kinase
VVICSVVPKALNIVERTITGHFTFPPVIIGRDIKVPLKNNYRNPRQVGQDRLVCAYAAKHLYGPPAIIVDFGTAITFDVISKQGSYEGGIIVPGIRLSAESLYKKTALLPKVSSIRGPKTLIGKDTRESILSGIFFGYGSMCCGLIDRIAKGIKGKSKVIVTGGHTHLMRKFIVKKITTIDKDLVFKGMVLLWQRSRKP